MDSKVLAERLLDAQVEYVLHELGGKRLAQVVARDVDDLLALGASLTVADVVDGDALKAVLRRLADQAGGSDLLEDFVLALAETVYGLDASENHKLGEVVDRGPVEALVVKVLGMRTLHERALKRMNQSPLVARVAQRFVTAIVNDFIAQNRQLAERLPGAKSLFSLGSSAARTVGRVGFVGAAADKGTQLAIKQTTGALRDVFKDEHLRGAAMEIWDLHAAEPLSELRAYLSAQDLREVAALLHAVVVSGRGSDFVGEAVDELVDALLERYGGRDLASVLAELNITRDDLVTDLRNVLPPIIEAAKADGRLEALVRARLEPFYRSKKVQALLTVAP
jgi:hypothetical protein